MCIRSRYRPRGVTLLELVIAIVIISIAVTGALTVFVLTSRGSAEPMVQEQAQLIAEAYLDEILLKKFYDPDTGSVCPAKEASRANYDNVCDYDGISSEVPTNQFGNAIGGLTDYAVSVSVVNNGVTLGGINNTGAIRVLRVDVTVTGQGGASVTLSGYRTNYECNAAADPGCKPL
jgi:MSHA pilin protein MshD